MNKFEKLKEKLEEHLRIANVRGQKDKALRLETEELEILINMLDIICANNKI